MSLQTEQTKNSKTARKEDSEQAAAKTAIWSVSTTLRQFAVAFTVEPPSRRERRDRRKARKC